MSFAYAHCGIAVVYRLLPILPAWHEWPLERIVAAAHRRQDIPESGRPGRIVGTRELVVSGTPYVAAYSVTKTTVRVLRILHGAQQWPDALPED
ncbi:hypothetical protein GFL54_31175 [Rhizobium laguerreae]|nr:hypothetical protein [Rhizobium laguerreae]